MIKAKQNNRFVRRLLLMLMLASLSGTLLLVAWLPSSAWVLLFVALVPLFCIADLSRQWLRFPVFGLIFIWIAMLIWNLDVIWISRISSTGALLAIMLNAMILSLPFLASLPLRIPPGQLYGHLLIGLVWIYVELFHHFWVFGFPWFSLGYGIAHQPWLIQWYAWLGVPGGSAWILLVNILIYHLFRGIFLHGFGRIAFIGSALTVTVILPVLISGYVFRKYEEHGEDVRVVALHTRLDVFDTKYQLSNAKLIDSYMEQSWTVGNDTTDLMLWPETAIPHGIWAHQLQSDPDLNRIRIFMQQNNIRNLVTGAVVKQLVENHEGHPAEKWDSAGSVWFREYNSALCILADLDSTGVKSKYRCVPFTEYTPDLAITRAIGKMIPSLAGYRFSVSEVHGHATFLSHDSEMAFLPLICYEAAFCTMKQMGKNHPSIILLLMNEGWYDSKKVASQFMYFAAARAIEQRRAVVRSSNAGISGVINQKGEVINISSGLGSQTISATVKASQKSTFFTDTASLLILLPLTLIIMIFVVIISD